MSFLFFGSGAGNTMQLPDAQFQVPPNLGRIIPIGIISAVIIGALFFLNWFLGVYTDWLWFGNLGYQGVFRTILLTRAELFIGGAIVFALIAGLNIYLTYLVGRGPQVAPLPEETLRLIRPLALWGGIFIIGIAAFIFGGALASRWEIVLGFLNSTPFINSTIDPPQVLADPQFGQTVEFFVFKLPFYHLIQGWLLGATVVSLILSLGMYFVHFSLRGAVFTFTTPVRVHASILGALALIALAWGYWLDVYDLVYSDSGAVVGATYADVVARVPALRALMVVVVLGAFILLANAFFVRGLKLITGVGILWLGANILLTGIYPSAVQRLQVDPNELRREAPYIGYNIANTRAGFGLDRVVEKDYSLAGDGNITKALADRNQDTINDIRLWDHRPFRSLLNQIQVFRLYYNFPNADSDRYLIGEGADARVRQVMLGTRELDTNNLPDEAQTWVNRKLQFTHGYGAVMAPVTEFTEEGEPVFFLGDIPPSIPPAGIDRLERPEVYYGESREDFVIVNSNQKELDYAPTEGSPVYTQYAGDGGVPLKNFFRRIAYAWEFKDFNILISGEIRSVSRIQYRRHVQERVATVAPFLQLDSDPYIVVSEGRLFWIQDAYTVTKHYPYSTPQDTALGQFNYIRNSVKVVLDVYHGSLDFYVSEPDDALIRTYDKIFPVLLKPLDQMPADLHSHIRYPMDLFGIQSQQYLTYHMTDITEFFNKEDQWAVSEEIYRGTFQPLEPYYLNMRLPDEEKEEFVLLLPFTPQDKDNMVGWLAARSDGEQYGKLVSFSFPKGVQVDGPRQVEGRIEVDPDITKEFTLLCEAGAGCIRGNLLVIPMEDRILYAEPLYLQAGSLALPQLKRVILADQGRVVMEETLGEAIAALVLGSEEPDSPSGKIVDPGAPSSTIVSPSDIIGTAKKKIGEITEVLKSLQEQLGELRETFGKLEEGKTQ
jgi:uncharacterized membrane protein (UPF0182 family)